MALSQSTLKDTPPLTIIKVVADGADQDSSVIEGAYTSTISGRSAPHSVFVVGEAVGEFWLPAVDSSTGEYSGGVATGGNLSGMLVWEGMTTDLLGNTAALAGCIPRGQIPHAFILRCKGTGTFYVYIYR